MPELEHVIEEVKRFLKDVETYLSVTLKKEKLKRETNAKREELLKDAASLIGKLSPHEIEEEEQEEYADVDLPTSASADKTQEEDEDECDDIYEDTVPESTHSNDSSQISEDEGEEPEERSGMFDLDGDPYGDVKVDPIAASDLTSPSKEGYLDKKRKEGQFGLQSWQKRYCIIKGNILYYYKKKTDKEQCNQIVLTGYQGREAPEFERKNKRKDLLFEVVCPAKRSYQFIAQNKKDLQEWIKAISVASKLGPSSVDPLAKSTPNNSGGSEDLSEEYDDTSAPGPSCEVNDDDYGDTYEDLDAYQATKMGGPVAPVAEPPAGAGENEEDVEPIDEEIYEDVPQAELPPPAPMPERIPKPSAANKPLPPEPPQSESPPPIPTSHRPVPPPSVPIDTQPARPYSPHMHIKTYPGKNIKNVAKPALGMSKPAIASTPAPPVPSRAANEIADLPIRKEPWEEDYANIYIGLWDCMADDQDELEFRRGEMVHIISKEYDTFSWWIGERNNKVGLVPKDYLMKAYMI
ncbi:src kinase-associated phosphoprotein 2-B-like [Acanthaster planci]|uniref:Src kinase-associated phosphoprotein 2-B-like n=1 Tax=Acanthaster planci TaxID=133434 RepID=A0A8B7XUZ9_ACAPL|nr:src kinase-associated phosphoprotein 2-B-like [Acanthaster planci]